MLRAKKGEGKGSGGAAAAAAAADFVASPGFSWDKLEEWVAALLDRSKPLFDPNEIWPPAIRGCLNDNVQLSDASRAAVQLAARQLTEGASDFVSLLQCHSALQTAIMGAGGSEGYDAVGRTLFSKLKRSDTSGGLGGVFKNPFGEIPSRLRSLLGLRCLEGGGISVDMRILAHKNLMELASYYEKGQADFEIHINRYKAMRVYRLAYHRLNVSDIERAQAAFRLACVFQRESESDAALKHLDSAHPLSRDDGELRAKIEKAMIYVVAQIKEIPGDFTCPRDCGHSVLASLLEVPEHLSSGQHVAVADILFDPSVASDFLTLEDSGAKNQRIAALKKAFEYYKSALEKAEPDDRLAAFKILKKLARLMLVLGGLDAGFVKEQYGALLTSQLKRFQSEDHPESFESPDAVSPKRLLALVQVMQHYLDGHQFPLLTLLKREGALRLFLRMGHRQTNQLKSVQALEMEARTHILGTELPYHRALIAFADEMTAVGGWGIGNLDARFAYLLFSFMPFVSQHGYGLMKLIEGEGGSRSNSHRKTVVDLTKPYADELCRMLSSISDGDTIIEWLNILFTKFQPHQWTAGHPLMIVYSKYMERLSKEDMLQMLHRKCFDLAATQFSGDLLRARDKSVDWPRSFGLEKVRQILKDALSEIRHFLAGQLQDDYPLVANALRALADAPMNPDRYFALVEEVNRGIPSTQFNTLRFFVSGVLKWLTDSNSPILSKPLTTEEKRNRARANKGIVDVIENMRQSPPKDAELRDDGEDWYHLVTSRNVDRLWSLPHNLSDLGQDDIQKRAQQAALYVYLDDRLNQICIDNL